VAGKIFINYRREDTAANALGVSQYLEKEFGRKNVFIDVDMHAGEKFPSILEQRLAQCNVMLVLIGPGWLNSCDKQGRRRLDVPDDWVRFEIAQALKRDIIVIPVLVGGANLPPRTELTEDIRGLVDHQAISITIPGFRHEMLGLVRDIRAIASAKSWWRFGVMPAGPALFLIALSLILISASLSSFQRVREIAFPPSPLPNINGSPRPAQETPKRSYGSAIDVIDSNNTTFGGALPIEVSKIYRSRFSGDDSSRYFKIRQADGEHDLTVEFTLVGPDMEVRPDIAIYDMDRNKLFSRYHESDDGRTIKWALPITPGDYVLEVKPSTSTGEFAQFRLSVTPNHR
jgi:hypothetical protein